MTVDDQAHQSRLAIITVTATDESRATVSLNLQVMASSADTLDSGLNTAIWQVATQSRITSAKASEWSQKLNLTRASDDGRSRQSHSRHQQAERTQERHRHTNQGKQAEAHVCRIRLPIGLDRRAGGRDDKLIL